MTTARRRPHMPPWQYDPPPPPPPPDGPRAMCEGLMVRDQTQARQNKWAGTYRSYVVQCYWGPPDPNATAYVAKCGNMQSAPGDPINPDVVAALAVEDSYAKANGYKIRLRIYNGLQAPDFAKRVNGFAPLSWLAKDFSTNTVRPVGTIGPFWRTDYQTLYDDFLMKLGAAIEPLTSICEVTISGTMTVFAEIMLKQWAYQDRATIVNAGYTYEQEMAAFQQNLDSHKAAFNSIGVASCIAANPFQHFDPVHGGQNVDTATTLTMLDAMATTLGRFTVWGNNSIGNNARNDPTYTQMYDYMKARRSTTLAFPIGLYFQTETVAKMAGDSPPSDPYNTTLWALDHEALSMEMPSGATTSTLIPTLSVAQCDTLNALFHTKYNALFPGG